MRTYLPVIWLPVLLTAATPEKCTTPLGVPCMTVEMIHEQRSVLHRGLNYYHTRTKLKVARASSGAVAIETASEEIPLMGAPQAVERSGNLFLPNPERVVRLFHAKREFSSREPMIWHDRPYRRAKPGDPTCATGILHSGTDFHQTGEQMILGIRTFRWYRPLANGGHEETFLAPALDCMALRRVMVHRNILRIPTFTDRAEATSIQFGEPDLSMFAVPAGYRQVPDPSAEQLRRFVEANRQGLQ